MQIEVKKVREFLGHRGAVYALMWHPELGLVTGGGNGWLVNWKMDDSAEGNLLAKVENRIFTLASHSNTILAGTLVGQLIFLQKVEDKWKPRVIKAHEKGLFAIFVHPDYFLTGGGDGYLCKWNWKGEQLIRIRLGNNSIRSFQLHPSENTLAVATSEGHVHFIDHKLLAPVIPAYQNAHDPSVFCSIWNTTGDQLVSGGRDALLKIWKYPDFQPSAEIIKAHLYTINAIAVSPSQKLLATASRDRTIKIWDRSTFALLKVIDVMKHDGHVNSVNNVIWNDAGLFSASDDRKIIQWDIKNSPAGLPKSDN